MDEETASDPREGPGAPQPKILAIALVVAVGTAAAFAILWLRDREASPGEVTAFLGRERAEISRTATSVLEGLTNYDAATIERRRAELEPLLTEDLRRQYDEIVTGGLDQALQQFGATAESDIVSGPDVAFVSSVRAEAVARVVQQVTLEDGDVPSTGFLVLRLTLIPEDDRWKVDGFEILSQHRSE